MAPRAERGGRRPPPRFPCAPAAITYHKEAIALYTEMGRFSTAAKVRHRGGWLAWGPPPT